MTIGESKDSVWRHGLAWLTCSWLSVQHVLSLCMAARLGLSALSADRQPHAQPAHCIDHRAARTCAPACRLRQHRAAVVLGCCVADCGADHLRSDARGDCHWHRICVSARALNTLCRRCAQAACSIAPRRPAALLPGGRAHAAPVPACPGAPRRCHACTPPSPLRPPHKPVAPLLQPHLPPQAALPLHLHLRLRHHCPPGRNPQVYVPCGGHPAHAGAAAGEGRSKVGWGEQAEALPPGWDGLLGAGPGRVDARCALPSGRLACFPPVVVRPCHGLPLPPPCRWWIPRSRLLCTHGVRTVQPS